jgi:predicted ATP-dependent serine protease
MLIARKTANHLTWIEFSQGRHMSIRNVGADMAVGPETKALAGVAGLDDILAGGLSRRHGFLLERNPGTGKTILVVHLKTFPALSLASEMTLPSAF